MPWPTASRLRHLLRRRRRCGADAERQCALCLTARRTWMRVYDPESNRETHVLMRCSFIRFIFFFIRLMLRRQPRRWIKPTLLWSLTFVEWSKSRLNMLLNLFSLRCLPLLSYFPALHFTSCNFMFCNFMPCWLVRHFHVRHFQRPRWYFLTYLDLVPPMP